MQSWLIWALLAMLTWGFWGLLPKLAVKFSDPTSALFFEAIGAGICGVTLALIFGGKPEFNPKGALFAGLTGMTAILGGWFYLYAARSAITISSVVLLTALYPIVTVMLAVVFLKEPMTTKQIIALILALLAVILLATEQERQDSQ
jgi:transporter family protein